MNRKALKIGVAAVLCSMAVSAQTLLSPNKQLQMDFSIEKGRPTYTLQYKGKTVIAPSHLGIELKGESQRRDFNDLDEKKFLYRAELGKEESLQFFRHTEKLPAIYGWYQNGQGWMPRTCYERIADYSYAPWLEGELRREYRTADPGLFLKAEDCPAGETPMDAESTRRAVCMLTCLPNGVQAMSGEIPGLVKTSLNLGILETAEEALSACFSVRSALGSQKEALKDRLACLMEELGGTVEYSGDYPAWEYREESPLRERMVQVFREQYGREPRIEAIHAGVECGLLAGKLPGLDCVSIGPDLLEIHTPRERMSIPSVQRVWAFLLEVLKRSK